MPGGSSCFKQAGILGWTHARVSGGSSFIRGIYCPYPNQTFHGHIMLNSYILAMLSLLIQKALLKYTKRKFHCDINPTIALECKIYSQLTLIICTEHDSEPPIFHLTSSNSFPHTPRIFWDFVSNV
jgi:hypothetical protein